MSNGRKQRKQRIDRDAVIEYVQTNPAATHAEIAALFGAKRSVIGSILRSHGIAGVYRGAMPKRKRGQTDEEYEWELKLHAYGLGVDRGMTLGGKPIRYGEDPRMEEASDVSVTLNSY